MYPRPEKPPLNITPILQAVTIALILWFGAKVTLLSEQVAVQEWRLNIVEKTLQKKMP
jgi:hypothetical protein